MRFPPGEQWRGNFHVFGTRPLLVALIVVVLMPVTAPAAFGQEATVATSASVTMTGEPRIDFPSGIVFDVELNLNGIGSAADVVQVDLLFRIAGDETLNLHPVSPDEITRVTPDTIAIDTAVDLQARFVPVGIDLTYHWQVHTADDTVLTSSPKEIAFYDDRYDWNSVSSEQVTLYYTEHDPAFADQMLDSAQSTIDEMEQRFSLNEVDPLTLWVYPSTAEFRGAQFPNSREAVAAFSYLGYDVIAAAIPDGNERELGRVIPHEVSHQVLHQATENPFTHPPVWFDEGMATHYQVGGTEFFQSTVYNAALNDDLFSISSLATAFPFQPQQAHLAYASSWSIIAYLTETYGDDGIARLIEAFGTGQPYDDALQAALGTTTEELNSDWLEWVLATATVERIAA